MGKIRPQERALLFIAALYADDGAFLKADETIRKNYGDVLLQSPAKEWPYSKYYGDELGCPITRRFIFFREQFDTGTLADVKLETNRIEEFLSVEGKRKVNLDPGYITLAKVVLASTKNYSHRICLGKGIYAEVSFVFRQGAFQSHLFTYRDYREKDCIEMFSTVRQMLKEMEAGM